MWPGPATGLGAVGTPGPRPRTGPRGGRPSLGRFLRPARWPPARPFPIARRRPRDRSDEGWAGSARPAGPKAPGSAGELCPREQLEAAAWKQGVACAAFPPGRPAGRCPGLRNAAPPRRLAPPKPRFFEGADWRPSQFLPAPGPLWSCPRNAWCRSPGPEQRVTEGLFSRPGAGMFSRRSRLPRPGSAAAAFLV